MDTPTKPAPTVATQNRHSVPGLLLVVVLASLLATAAGTSTLLRDIESRTYDLRVRWHTPREPARLPITILAVDDESLARLEPAAGRWPWPRALFATVLDYASEARLIGLDILFPESDAAFTPSDDAFALQVTEQGRVVGATFYDQNTRAWIEPYPALKTALRGLGHVHVVPDADGVARRHLTRSPFGGEPRLSLAAQLAFQLATHTNASLRFPDSFLFCPLATRPKVISIADVMTAWRDEQQGRVPDLSRTSFAGRIVLIGSLATGLPLDREVTPVSESEAGVLITATALDNLATGRFYHRVTGRPAGLLAVTLALLPFAVRTRRPLAYFSATTLLPVGYSVLAQLAVEWARWMLPLTVPLLAWLISATARLVQLWIRERARRLELQALEQSKQAFTDMLVHDLRNRVFAARASLQTLARTLRQPNGSPHPLASVAEASLQSMLVEVNSLLDLRRMEEGRLQVTRDTVEVAGLLDEVVRDYTAAAALTQATLAVRFTPDTPATLSGDRPLLLRLLSNLVINALQHGSARTEVTLMASRHDQHLRLSVANRGPVLSEEARRSLFQPFARLAGSSAHRGTGLGLTLARLAAEAHGGKLDVESPWFETGDGAAIHLHLPLHTE
jgi:signal transduction histidine kinase